VKAGVLGVEVGRPLFFAGAVVFAGVAFSRGAAFFADAITGEDTPRPGVALPRGVRPPTAGGGGFLTTAPGSKMPVSLRARRVSTRSLVMRSWMAFCVGFSLYPSAMIWYSLLLMSRPNPKMSSLRSASASHFMRLSLGLALSGLMKPPSAWESMLGCFCNSA